VDMDEDYRVRSFIEKPVNPPSNLVNMGVYLFEADVLNRALWDDHQMTESSHDFGKDILPRMVKEGARVFAYPYSGYWVDVGTVSSYWQAHMDLLNRPSPIDLHDRSWIIHTRTEERPPVQILQGATVIDSMITDGCVIYPGATVERSILSPGVTVKNGAIVRESVVLTDTVIEPGAIIERTIIDKRAQVGENARVGAIEATSEPRIAMIGKNSVVAAGMIIQPGAIIGTDVIPEDFNTQIIQSDDYIQTKRLAYEV
jgi:glucose-1-phosphate adenylyltransferase